MSKAWSDVDDDNDAKAIAIPWIFSENSQANEPFINYPSFQKILRKNVFRNIVRKGEILVKILFFPIFIIVSILCTIVFNFRVTNRSILD